MAKTPEGPAETVSGPTYSLTVLPRSLSLTMVKDWILPTTRMSLEADVPLESEGKSLPG